MRKKEKIFVVFFIFLILSGIVLGISIFGKFAPVYSILEKTTSFVSGGSYQLFQASPFLSDSEEVERLRSQNADLRNKIIEQERVLQENEAFRAQFQSTEPKSKDLLPARIVGFPGFLPGISKPSGFIINKGENDGVNTGQSVVYQNNLVGLVSKTSVSLSVVSLVTNESVAFPARTLDGSAGVIKGMNDDKMTLDNVLPSEELKVGDIVLTKGDMDVEGKGTLPDLVVGEIQSVEKIPAAVFQRAEVKSLVDIESLSTVFILTGIK